MNQNSVLAFFVILLLLIPKVAIAEKVESYQHTQMLKIEGIVVDKSGESLPGVTVKIKGRSQGMLTDYNGKFFFDIPLGTVLQFSFIGMNQKEVVVSSTKSLYVVLEEEESLLEEVVVTGYSETTKRRTTGSVATVNVANLVKENPIKNIDQLLQGQVAGVAVQAISGRPGETSKIRIRGTNTMTGNAEPLWVVDGVPLQRNEPRISSSQVKTGDLSSLFIDGIAGINPNDIENVTILKDASAAAIYGSRAASGVIVVTTKRGKAGKMKANFSSNLSLQMAPQRDANLMNSQQKLSFEQDLWDEFSATGFANNTHYPVIGIVGMIRAGKEQYAGLSVADQNKLISDLSSQTTDWFDVLFRNSISQSYYASASGGTEKNTYYISLGYSGNNGIVKKTNANRYNVNLKLNTTATDKLSFGMLTDLSYQTSDGPSNSVNPFKYAYFANPYETPFNTDGSYRADNTYFNMVRMNGGYIERLPPGGFNVFREMDETYSQVNSTAATVTGDMRYRFNQNLRLTGLASYSYSSNNSDNMNGKNTYAAWLDRPFDNSALSTRTYSSLTQSSSYTTAYNLRLQLSYDTSFGTDHRVSMLGGTEIRGDKSKTIFEKRYGYDDVSGNSSIPVPPQIGDKIDYNELISYANIVDGLAGQSIIENAFASFYFSADYALKGRYIWGVSARTDGSNKFGQDQQFNPTGSLGFAWNADKESFFKALTPVMSSLSLKFAGGYTGNTSNSVYPQLVMMYNSSFRKTQDDYYRMGSIKNAPNKNLRWEKTFDTKLAVDAGFFKDRIKLLVEAYYRDSRDVVTSVKVPSYVGFSSQSYNTSEIENRGLEFTLSTVNIKTKDLRWTSSFNIGYNMNKLVKYFSPTGAAYSSTRENYPLSSIFGGKVTGIDSQTGIYTFQLRPDANPKTNKEWQDANNYLFYLGTRNAPFNGGFNTGVKYKDFSFSLSGAYSLGQKILNQIAAPKSHSSLTQYITGDKETIPTQKNDLYVLHFNTTQDAVNRWTPDNPRTDANPRIIDAFAARLGLSDKSPGTSWNLTDAVFLENISYLKLTSLSVFYSVPERHIKHLGIESVGLSLSMNNLFTFTNYSGIDPETPGAVYPMSRTYSFGVNVSF